MKSYLVLCVLLAAGIMLKAQPLSDQYLQKVPALPKDSCDISRQAAEMFHSRVVGLATEVETQLSSLRKLSKSQANTNEAVAKQNAAKQMAQYGLSAEEMKKMQSGQMTSAEKKAMAEKMMQQQTNMSMSEVQNLGKMSEAGRQAYVEAYGTEAMATAQSQPSSQNEGAKNTYNLVGEQQSINAGLEKDRQAIAALYAAIDNDPERMASQNKIAKWRSQWTSLGGEDGGQGRTMDSLQLLIKKEQLAYCDKYMPRYRAALRKHHAIVQASLPGYRRMGEISAELSLAQIGTAPPPQCAESGGLEAIGDYLDKLAILYDYKLYWPEE